MDSNFAIKTELLRHYFYGLCSKSQSLFIDFEEFPVDFSYMQWPFPQSERCKWLPTTYWHADSKAAKKIWLGLLWHTENTSCGLDGKAQLLGEGILRKQTNRT